MKTILNHFKKVDPIMHQVLSEMQLEVLKPRTERPLFQEIAENIISQQLTGKVADIIIERFRALLNQEVTPEKVLAFPDEAYREVGFSWAKARYVRDLALKTVNGELQLEDLTQMEDEAVIEHLIKVNGIGRWTAEMLLMFTLGRPNVFSYGDLALKKGLVQLYNINPKFSLTEAEPIVNRWSPYRTYAALGLWRVVDLSKLKP